MELRSFNVERVYSECVVNVGKDKAFVKAKLTEHKSDIADMVSQLAWNNNEIVFQFACFRADGEKWTPYLQIIKMLFVLAKKINIVTFAELNENSVIRWEKQRSRLISTK